MRKFINFFGHAVLICVAISIVSPNYDSKVSAEAELSCGEVENINDITVQYDCDSVVKKIITQKNTSENRDITISTGVLPGLISSQQNEKVTRPTQEIPIQEGASTIQIQVDAANP